MPDFDNLLTDDQTWWQDFAASLKVLEDFSTGSLVLWPVDDLIGSKRYVACPRRGQHQKLVECWMCWCDVAYGHATASQVLADGAAGRG